MKSAKVYYNEFMACFEEFDLHMIGFEIAFVGLIKSLDNGITYLVIGLLWD